MSVKQKTVIITGASRVNGIIFSWYSPSYINGTKVVINSGTSF